LAGQIGYGRFDDSDDEASDDDGLKRTTTTRRRGMTLTMTKRRQKPLLPSRAYSTLDKVVPLDAMNAMINYAHA
jgi:hypothetical protein